nr:hypothetical protein [Streptomyces sp. 846.5]
MVGTFSPGGTALSGSATYDPLGNVTGGSALPGHLGFQSGWTEQATARSAPRHAGTTRRPAPSSNRDEYSSQLMSALPSFVTQ